jgi:hypothetical protein
MRPFPSAGAPMLACAAAPTVVGDGGIAYPAGYRHWTHVKTMLIEPGHPLYGSFGGIHHLYANDKAMAGFACHASQKAHGYVYSRWRP